MPREFRMGGSGGGDTGRLFEERVFGIPEIDTNFIFLLEKLPHGRGKRFQNDEQVIRLFKESYRSDTRTSPPSKNGIPSHFIDLRLAVVDALGLNEEEAEQVECYSSLHTVIDHLMGVDGFIEYKDPRTGKMIRVTFDATLNRDKDKIKADIIIRELPDAVQEEGAYFKAIEDYGHKAAVLFQRRLNGQARA